MKKYTRPTIAIVELQAKENIAAQNPLDAVVVDGATTTYNLALFGAGSVF
jgi:hypothetical protein